MAGEITTKTASMRQLHAAIQHHAKGEDECAITLAAAAEGMLIEPDEPTFRQRVKEYAAKLPEATEGATNPNDFITWLKHGTFGGKKCEKATIDDSEAPVIIWRAITKFYGVYKEVSAEMVAWQEKMKKELPAKTAVKAAAAPAGNDAAAAGASAPSHQKPR